LFILYKNALKDEDKMIKINPRAAMLVTGEPGDKVQFAEYIQRNLQLYKMVNGYDLSTHAAVNYTRRELAQSLRSRQPYAVNMLVAGYDNDVGPSLFFLDYLASCVKVPFGIHGYGSYFGLSICDKYYKKDCTEAEALSLLNKIIAEVNKIQFY
jgi:20S proteasome subunit beta 4